MPETGGLLGLRGHVIRINDAGTNRPWQLPGTTPSVYLGFQYIRDCRVASDNGVGNWVIVTFPRLSFEAQGLNIVGIRGEQLLCILYDALGVSLNLGTGFEYERGVGETAKKLAHTLARRRINLFLGLAQNLAGFDNGGIVVQNAKAKFNGDGGIFIHGLFGVLNLLLDADIQLL